MRNIKFRGKTRSGYWVYGNLLLLNKTYYIVPQHESCAKADSNNLSSFPGYEEYTLGIEVIPETIGQFVDIKDKNNTKVYKHDILKTDNGLQCVVKWYKGCFCCFPLKGSCRAVISLTDFINHFENRFEVIGNIHEFQEE